MLKWTVNRRIDPLAVCTAAAVTRNADRLTKRRSMGAPLQSSRVATDPRSDPPRRKSLATAEFTRRYRQRCANKENMHIASPHPMAVRQQAGNAATSTPYAHQSSALRDVGNTTPQRRSLNALNTTPVRKRNLPPSPLLGRASPVAVDVHRAATPPSVVPVQAVTLQTLPSGAAIAMRGLTVPLHFRAEQQPPMAGRSTTDMSPLSRRLAELRFSKVSIQRHQIFSNQCDDEDDMMNLSSKALNDTALDLMIDEILYSTRKVRPLISRACAPVPPAPQVTPDSTMLLQASAPVETAADVAASIDIRSPEPEVCQLRRQGGLRRKRTHKTCESGGAEQTRSIDALMASHPYLRQSIEILASMETPPKKMRWV